MLSEAGLSSAHAGRFDLDFLTLAQIPHLQGLDSADSNGLVTWWVAIFRCENPRGWGRHQDHHLGQRVKHENFWFKTQKKMCRNETLETYAINIWQSRLQTWFPFNSHCQQEILGTRLKRELVTLWHKLKAWCGTQGFLSTSVSFSWEKKTMGFPHVSLHTRNQWVFDGFLMCFPYVSLGKTAQVALDPGTIGQHSGAQGSCMVWSHLGCRCVSVWLITYEY